MGWNPFREVAKIIESAVDIVKGVVGGIVGVVSAIFSPPSYDMPSASAEAAASQNGGALLNKQGTDNPIPVIYGVRKVGGTRVFAATNGTSNSNLYIALVLCEGEINSIKKIYIEDTLVWEGTSTTGTAYSANTSNFKNYFNFETWHGNANQTASTLLSEAPGWGAAYKLSGLAYLACKCIYPDVKSNDDAKNNPWSGFPNITVELEGKQVKYPSNLGITYSGLSYTARQNFSNYFTTTGYSNNPVDCLLEYLRNTTYGKGLSDTQIDWHSFYTARVKWTKDQNGNTLADNKTHKTNGIIFTDRTVMENVKTFLLNMRSALVYQDGRYRLVVVDNASDTSIYYATSTSVMTITEDDILNGIRIGVESGDSKFNRVTITYMGGSQVVGGTTINTYEPLDYVFPQEGTLKDLYLTQDNNRVVETKITLEHITDATTAAKMAQILCDRSRYRGKTISFQGTARLFQLEVGDVITITYQSLSINGQYRVKDIIQNADFTFNITVEEHTDAVYAYNPNTVVVPKMRYSYYGDGSPAPVTPVPVLPSDPGRSTPTTVSHSVALVNHGTWDSISVSYTTPTDTTLEKLRVYYLDSSSNTWQQLGEVPLTHTTGSAYYVIYFLPVNAGIKTWKLRIHTIRSGNESAATNWTITNTSTTPGQQVNGVSF
jgi:hypothetical protein